MSETAEATRTIDGIQAPGPGTWSIDPAHTTIGFVARHMMVTKVRGHFGSFAGQIRVDEDALASSVEMDIEAGTITTGNDMRDRHLVSPDFLDVETFPTLSYRSTRLERTGGNRFRLHGDLTIKDVTRPVTLDVEYEGIVPDLRGGTRMAFSASAEIDREEFGITWNVALEGGGVLVSKKVKLEIEVAAVLAAGEQAA